MHDQILSSILVKIDDFTEIANWLVLIYRETIFKINKSGRAQTYDKFMPMIYKSVFDKQTEW